MADMVYGVFGGMERRTDWFFMFKQYPEIINCIDILTKCVTTHDYYDKYFHDESAKQHEKSEFLHCIEFFQLCFLGNRVPNVILEHFFSLYKDSLIFIFSFAIFIA
jgi:hypothetical protein